MQPKILAFGEILWDKYPTESFIGGAALNFIAHCAKCGADSALFTAVGRDADGDAAFAVLNGFGVRTDFVKQTDKGTGLCLVSLDEAGIPSYNVLTDTAYDNITVTDADIARVRDAGFDALYFGTLIQRSPVSRASLRRLCAACDFPAVVCDVNLRVGCYDADSVRFCLENASVLKISDEEEPLMQQMGLYTAASREPDDIAAAVCARYPQIRYLLLTRGGEGCFVWCADESRGFSMKAKSVPVASTVGAGDSFTAAWMMAHLSGKSPKAATEAATALSAFVVSRTDAVPDYEAGDFLGK